MNETEFLSDCLTKAEVRIERTEAERDRWRSLLVEVVGELNAERMYRDPDRGARP